RAQIREILISESAWEEMTCLFAPSLIKSLAYYCQLSDSRCVAEGVDSLAKFTQLKSLGIDRF
ncbi:hypothetical protein, partial [Klebsiella pneumoniae]|uniref:hypothetical protein n=1 Tax=Klebsiella pneumoniae TaxID=573 RepID=UPI000D4815FF